MTTIHEIAEQYLNLGHAYRKFSTEAVLQLGILNSIFFYMLAPLGVLKGPNFILYTVYPI